MKIRIKINGSGCDLMVGKVYNLSGVSAKTLISKSQAEKVADDIPVTGGRPVKAKIKADSGSKITKPG